MALSEYDFVVRYRPGTKISHANGLSRLPAADSDELSNEVEDDVAVLGRIAHGPSDENLKRML
jgi:hypothetical protein